jgi:hypothetical protein
MKKLFLLSVSLLIFSSASAQESGKIALNFGILADGIFVTRISDPFLSPTPFIPSIGFTYQFTSRLAIRPTFFLSRITSKRLVSSFRQPQEEEFNTDALGITLTGLLYLTRNEASTLIWDWA